MDVHNEIRGDPTNEWSFDIFREPKETLVELNITNENLVILKREIMSEIYTFFQSDMNNLKYLILFQNK